jgi:hypothetical protein
VSGEAVLLVHEHGQWVHGLGEGAGVVGSQDTVAFHFARKQAGGACNLGL